MGSPSHIVSVHVLAECRAVQVSPLTSSCSMQGAQLVDGYAPFCKHVFVRNFVGAKLGALKITDENKHLLQCGYSRRRPEELPVLAR